MCETADEAIKTMLAERKLSSKINYDVLRGLKSEDGGSGSSDMLGYDDGNDSDDNTRQAGDLVPKVESSSLSTIIEEEEGELTSSSGQMAVVYESGPTLATSSSRRAGSKRRLV